MKKLLVLISVISYSVSFGQSLESIKKPTKLLLEAGKIQSVETSSREILSLAELVKEPSVQLRNGFIEIPGNLNLLNVEFSNGINLDLSTVRAFSGGQDGGGG